MKIHRIMNTEYIWVLKMDQIWISNTTILGPYYSQIVRINRPNTDHDYPEWEIEACCFYQDQYEYVATVIERSSNATRMVTFPTPDFNLSQLEPGTNYSIQLFAQNKIGEQQSFSALPTFLQSFEVVVCNKHNLCQPLPFLSTFQTQWCGSHQTGLQFDAKFIRIILAPRLRIRWMTKLNILQGRAQPSHCSRTPRGWRRNERLRARSRSRWGLD